MNHLSINAKMGISFYFSVFSSGDKFYFSSSVVWWETVNNYYNINLWFSQFTRGKNSFEEIVPLRRDLLIRLVRYFSEQLAVSGTNIY